MIAESRIMMIDSQKGKKPGPGPRDVSVPKLQCSHAINAEKKMNTSEVI